MSLFNPFRPRWKHPKPHNRLSSLENLEDLSIVGYMALEDIDSSIRKAAVIRLANLSLAEHSIFTSAALRDADPTVRMVSLNYVEDPSAICGIALEDPDGLVREEALTR